MKIDEEILLLRNECQRILRETENIVSEEDEKFLIENVFSRDKIWNDRNLVCISVGSCGYGKKCFYAVRKDGNSHKLSYTKCLNIISKKQYIYCACRDAAKYPIAAKKAELLKDIKLPYTCPITGITAKYKKYFSIDLYENTFKEVVDMWIKEKGEDYLYNDITENYGFEYGPSCANFNVSIQNDFIDFLFKHTNFRLIPFEKKS